MGFLDLRYGVRFTQPLLSRGVRIIEGDLSYFLFKTERLRASVKRLLSIT